MENTMKITEVKVFPVKEEKLRAFVSVVLDDCFMVNDIKVISGRDGYFISMPSRRKKNGKFKDVAHPLNNETRQMMEGRILEEYERVAAGGEPVVAAPPRAQAKKAVEKPLAREEEISESRSVDEVAEAHLRDSFWGT
jgi:stage V sporulation protein G